jgi:acylphosphatase
MLLMTERRVILFSGRVQGVGFRMTALQLATDLPLTGTVRNLDDGGGWDGGGVELVVEGEAGEIDHLVERLGEQFGSFIRSVSQRSVPPTGLPGRGIRIIH